jgi:hypothetical protein
LQSAELVNSSLWFDGFILVKSGTLSGARKIGTDGR